jgi:hypothetical protein
VKRKYPFGFFDKNVVCYESMKGDLKTRPIYECRFDERLKTKDEESTCLTYTGLIGELEHLKIETVLEVISAPSIFKLIRKDTVLVYY